MASITSSKFVRRTALVAGLTLCFGTLAACAKKPPPEKKPVPLDTLEVRRVSAALGKPEVDAEYWRDAQPWSVDLMAQPMIAPRPEVTTTSRLVVQAVHDGKRVAFRLRWKDSEKSEGGRLAEYSDALALQFPLHDGPPPPVMMGAKGSPVHIFHWRAQYQADRERGKPTVKQLYPNQSVDMYPHEYKDAPSDPVAAVAYSPGVALGNPQSHPKRGVDEIVAEGFSTSAVQPGKGSDATGVFQNGEWTLVLVRPLASEGGSSLKVNGASNIAFAVWQGGRGEVGSRKCVTMQWYPLKIL